MVEKKKTNGHSNGSLNGLSHMNGKSQATRQRTSPVKRTAAKNGFLARIINITARLLTWYSIISILFRCPATIQDLTETSPKVCKPYFQVKDIVSPHLTPYYDTYAAPYVEKAKPYYNSVDRTVITPARIYAVKYGGPQLQRAQTMGLAQWEKTVQPQIVKYQGLAKAQYDKNAAPHVNKATEAVAPYYNIAKTNALQTYHDVMLPAYVFVQPYALQGYDIASTFTVDTAVPPTLWAWNKTYIFLDGVVWPRVRNVYVKTVDPQVARIMERLGRHQDKRVKTFSDEAESSSVKSAFVKPTASVSTTASSSTATTKAAQATPEPESVASSVEAEAEPSTSVEVQINTDGSEPSKDNVREAAAKTVADDLEQWQGKFTKAAAESADEIEERVQDIADRLIKEEAGVVGKSHLTKLDETVKTGLSELKKTLVTILEKHRDAGDKTDASQLEEEVAAAVRTSGLKIRDQAQEIRTWRQKYDEEMETALTAIAQEHITILEGIRDLALQKLGMKWAWMDGVTYKDWQKYHQLRARLDEWTDQLKDLVTSHPSLPAVQTASTDIEDEGMAVAAEAAQELGNLKQVAAWKAIAGDYTDNFDASTMKLAAEAAQEKAAEVLKEAAGDAEEIMHSAAGKVKDSVESVGEAISEAASSVKPSQATASSEAVDADTSAVPPLESMASEPTESASDLSSKSANTAKTSAAEPVEPLPTPEVVDGPEQVEESIIASPDDPSSSAGSATPSVKSAMFGAAAQSVPSRQPIMDDDDEDEPFLSNVKSALPTDAAASVTSAAQAAYTSAIAQAADKYSSAMSAVSVQVSGTPKPAHEEMFSSVSQGYFDALATANSRLQSAATAASQGIYGTPTTKWMPDMPTMPSVDWERVQSIAQQNLQDSVNWAGEQFENAKVAIGAAEPTPSTPSERAAKMLDQAKHNYYAGLGLAHARYSDFLSAASTAVSSMTATPTPTNMQGTASSMASVAGESASSVAAAASEAAAEAVLAAGDSASSVAAAASEAAASAAAVAGDSASAAGDSVAANWDFLVSRVSSQVYGAPTPTPWYENLYAAAGDYASQAGEYAASATGAAAEYAANVGDAAADSLSSANSVAGEYAGSATEAAAAQYSVVSSLVSELIVGKEPTVTESVFARLAGVYGAATATAASAWSEASVAAASAAGNVADSASSMTEMVKETVDHIRDEL